MTLNNYFVEPPADWLFRPHGRVVALLDDDISLAAALEELRSRPLTCRTERRNTLEQAAPRAFTA